MAIEFAIVAIPFIYMLVAIIELSLMFTSAALLESATSAAARQIRTGAIQQAAADNAGQEALFRQAFCNNITALIDCNAVQIEAADIGDFSSYNNYLPQYDEDGNFTPQGFNAGEESDVVLIRTVYRYAFMTPFIGQFLGEGGSGMRTFMSTIVLQTEPYKFVL
ncbi:MAG: pilus assembly protein [Alphaproteobacteria bacterium]|nr:pilus assembly protein [Alphaproteobacteria bacterium]